MKKQGQADFTRNQGTDRTRPYSVNQNFPSQLGSAIDPMAVEKFHEGPPGIGRGPTDGMDQGPGANRTVKANGSQGRHK